MDTGKKSSRNDQNTPTIQYETTEKISDLRKLSISQILSPKVKKTVQHSREMSLTSESLEDKNEENQYEKETTFEQLRTDKVKENNGKQKYDKEDENKDVNNFKSKNDFEQIRFYEDYVAGSKKNSKLNLEEKAQNKPTYEENKREESVSFRANNIKGKEIENEKQKSRVNDTIAGLKSNNEENDEIAKVKKVRGENYAIDQNEKEISGSKLNVLIVSKSDDIGVDQDFQKNDIDNAKKNSSLNNLFTDDISKNPNNLNPSTKLNEKAKEENKSADFEELEVEESFESDEIESDIVEEEALSDQNDQEKEANKVNFDSNLTTNKETKSPKISAKKVKESKKIKNSSTKQQTTVAQSNLSKALLRDFAKLKQKAKSKPKNTNKKDAAKKKKPNNFHLNQANESNEDPNKNVLSNNIIQTLNNRAGMSKFQIDMQTSNSELSLSNYPVLLNNQFEDFSSENRTALKILNKENSLSTFSRINKEIEKQNKQITNGPNIKVEISGNDSRSGSRDSKKSRQTVYGHEKNEWKKIDHGVKIPMDLFKNPLKKSHILYSGQLFKYIKFTKKSENVQSYAERFCVLYRDRLE